MKTESMEAISRLLKTLGGKAAGKNHVSEHLIASYGSNCEN